MSSVDHNNTSFQIYMWSKVPNTLIAKLSQVFTHIFVRPLPKQSMVTIMLWYDQWRAATHMKTLGR